MRRAAVAGVLALALLVPTARDAGAQRVDALPAGARLRVRTPAPPRTTVEGTLVRHDSGRVTLALPDGGAATLPLVPGTRVERHVGRRSAGGAFGRGALVGAIVGATVGGAATGLAAWSDHRNPCGDCFITPTAAIGVASVAFTAASTLVGGGIGLLLPRDRWARVPLAR